MAATATYVYCVVHRDRPMAVRNVPPGVPGSSRPVLLEVPPGLWIVVSTVPLAVYGPDRIEPRLRDLDWVARVALAHEAVVERFGRIDAATVVPMKLFTMFSEPARAIAEMRSRRRELLAVIKRIRGCQEWGVRLTHGADEPKRAVPPTRARSGAEFLAAKKQVRDAARDRARRLRAEAEGVLFKLRRLARQAKRRLPPESAAPPPILEADFLVPRSAAVQFQAAARQAAARCRAAGGDLVLTGPWPAYNFIDEGEPRT
jgi:hypothetical protein